MFDEITFPLGPRSLEGKWLICAQDWPSIFDVEKSEKYCIEFWVEEDYWDDPFHIAANKTELLMDENAIDEALQVKVELEVPKNFRPSVPFGGKVSKKSLESTVWKLKNFSVNQILRQINFGLLISL